MKVEIIEATPNPEETVCKAARNDYSDEYIGDKSFEEVMEDIDGESIEEKKKTLIHHLLDHGHFGPFEHPQITFAVEGMSRSCMAQLTRHRHASFDVQSMRYVSFDDMDPTPGEAVVEIPALNDPGLTGRNADFADGEGEMDDKTILKERRMCYNRAIEQSFKDYQNLLDLGVPAQDARMVLPIGTKINMVFSVNARMLMHIADMRAAADAQWEIREMTEEVLDLAEGWCPTIFGYYNDEMKNRKNRLAP